MGTAKIRHNRTSKKGKIFPAGRRVIKRKGILAGLEKAYDKTHYLTMADKLYDLKQEKEDLLEEEEDTHSDRYSYSLEEKEEIKDKLQKKTQEIKDAKANIKAFCFDYGINGTRTQEPVPVIEERPSPLTVFG